MHSPTQLLRLFLLLAVLSLSLPEMAWGQLGKKVKSAYKFGKQAYKSASKALKTYNDCVSQGYSMEQCQRAAVLCGTYQYYSNNPPPGLPAAMFYKLQLFQLFKPNCGDGDCYQCCFNGGNCHTSFVGFPVINCNYNYGPLTQAAGMALVVGGQPGDPCLFTPQTCDHLALCHSTQPPATIEAINNDPNHVMKTQHAKEQRARRYAEDLLENQWTNFMANLSIGDPLLSDSMVPLYDELKIIDLMDFASARGHRHWREFLDDLSTYTYADSAFAIIDTMTNELLEGPSAHNFSRQLALAQMLSNVPNLRNRLDYIGSYIWTPSSMAAYWASVGDPDSAMLARMNPLAYYFHSESSRMQDHRLLAVPLLDENLPSNYYAGDTLGTPPVLRTEKTLLPNNLVQLRLSVLHPGTHDPNYPFEGMVYWGDGTATEYQLANFLQNLTLQHTYRSPGGYQAFSILQNSTGLRSVNHDPVLIQSSTNHASITETPVTNTLWLHNVSMGTTLFTFTEKIGLNITTGVDSVMVPIGAEGIRTFNNYTLHQYDTIVAHSNFQRLDSLVIQPYFVNDAESGYTLLFFSHLKGLVYDPALDRDTIVPLPLSLDSIRLYDQWGHLITNPALKLQDGNGQFTIYVEYDTINVGKVVLPISATGLRNHYIPPISTSNWQGNDTLYLEVRPDYFVPHVMPECGYDPMNISYNPIPSGLYEVAGSLYSSGLVPGGNGVTFRAEDGITLYSNFQAQLGSNFLAEISPCVPLGAANPEHNSDEGDKSLKEGEKTLSPIFECAQTAIRDKGLLRFHLPVAAEVGIRLVNSMGQTFYLMQKTRHESGSHQFTIDRGALPAGAYRVEFLLNERIERSERMVFL